MLPLLASVLGAERNFEFSVLTCFALRFDLKRKAFQPSLPCVSACFASCFSLFRAVKFLFLFFGMIFAVILIKKGDIRLWHLLIITRF